MNLHLNKKKNWQQTSYKNFKIHFKGSFSNWKDICSFIEREDKDAIKTILNREFGCYAFIIIGKNKLFATVDHICSIPLYYSDGHISNCAHTLRNDLDLNDINRDSVKEFSMTGYCTGRNTIYEKLFMLQAGEFFITDSGDSMTISNHFSYLPSPDNTLKHKKAIKELENTIDNVFKRLVMRLNGKTVLLPLSGGLDSRLVLTKLLEHGHDNIITFSYGVRNNGEEVIAKRIAKRLNIKWISITSKNPRGLFNKPIRKDFDEFVDGLSIVPSYLDFEALYMISDRKDVPKDSVIINGQTGDFIAGEHIPETLVNKASTVAMAIDEIAKKHYRQNLNIKASKISIYNNLNKKIDDLDKQEAYSVFEFWEWQERQAKAVMVGQRSYDFFGYEWELPLWDKEIVDFFARVPPELKLKRQLMVDYLNEYNPNNVFTDDYPEITPWPKGRGGIKWIARIYGLIVGRKAKEACYSYFYYFSNYHNQFALLGHEHYLKNYKTTKSFVGQAAIHWLAERGIKNND